MVERLEEAVYNLLHVKEDNLPTEFQRLNATYALTPGIMVLIDQREGSSRFSQEISLRLGILTSGLCLLKEGDSAHPWTSVGFPATEHLASCRAGGISSYNSWERKEGNLRFPLECLTHFSPTLHNDRDVALFVGDEIPAYFWLNGRSLPLNFLRTQFSNETPARILHRESLTHLDSSYAIALDLLGQAVPSEFRAKYDAEGFDRRVSVLKHLDRLRNEQQSYETRIQQVYSRIGQVGIEDGAISLLETEDDAFWASARSRERNRETVESIKSFIKEAALLGMHHDSWQISIDHGTVRDVSKYIQGLAKEYQVKLE